MPPSYGVNNLLLRNFLESIISLGWKSVIGYQQISRVIYMATLVFSFSPNIVAPTAQVLKRRTLSFKASANPYCPQAPLEVLVLLLLLRRHPCLQFPRYFIHSFVFICLQIALSFFA
jgi:hypothetical protein